MLLLSEGCEVRLLILFAIFSPYVGLIHTRVFGLT